MMGRGFLDAALPASGLFIATLLAPAAWAQQAERLPYPTTGYSAPPPLVAPPSGPAGGPVAAPTPAYDPQLAPPPPTATLPTPPPAIEAAPPAVEPVVVPPTPADAVDSTLSDPIAITPEERPVRWYFPWSWFQPTPWDSGFELGINGATGTSDTLSVRTGGYIKRDTGRNKIDLSLYYNKTTADGDETQNNAIMKARNDRMLGQSPWSIFVMSQLFYDEFQAFDLNVNINSGIGFKVFDEDWVKLRTSLGAGASREFGGVDEEWTPEAQCGFDWEQKITETQKFYAGVDFFPEFGDFGNYRVLTDMGLEIELSRPSNVSLKISATDRYDSQSDGFEPHNTNYSVLLLWKH